MNRALGLVFSLSLILVSFEGTAHHSRATFFDMSQTIELEGEITRVQWRHPHVRYWIQADAAYGGEEWELETTPPSLLERQGISPDILAAGTRVRVAGPPSKLNERAMEVSHVLLPDGREVLLHTGRAPLWTNETVERVAQEEFDQETIGAAEAMANGIFRVWSRPIAPDRQSFWLDSYPLTGSARAVSEAWDAVSGVDTACAGKDMPWVMSSNWPFQFVDNGEEIRLLAEEFDRVRIIHLRGATGDVLPAPLGYSVGYWEDDSLIVNTTHINSMRFNGRDIPLSGDVEILETFTLSADESRLDHEMTVIDPATFTEPVTLSSYWIWRPGEMVKPYNCIDTPGSWSDDENKKLLGR